MINSDKGSKLYLGGLTFVAVLGGLLFGYDTAVISGAEKALEAFFSQSTDFVYNKAWHGITASSALIGCVIGGALSGLLAPRWGRRNSLIFASMLFFLSAIGSWRPEMLFFEFGKPSFSLLLTFNAYRVLGGIGVGLASAICPMYIAEVSPANVRGRLVSVNQFAIIFGMLVVYFVNYLIRINLPGSIEQAMMELGWRRMFLSEAFPAATFGLLLLFVPKTPRFLVMSGNESKALHVLTRINGMDSARKTLAEIKETVVEKREKLFSYGVTVVVIGILLSFFQQAVGINVVLYYAPRIFENLGASGDVSMRQTVVMGVVNIIFTMVAILTVDKFGRKPLLIIGSIGMMVGMAALSVLSFMDVIGVAALVFIIIYTASFMMSWGPITWVLISEIFPNTIRGQAVAIAVAAQWISNFVVSSTFPSLSEWSTGGAYLIYAVFSLLSAVFVFKMVPETKGKTLEDMTRLWRK
ncbi:MAG: D-xylose transporter XylE [Bacteroidales bacterium]|nr:D-xylose transporter XylE [Bacteroidales bacterium]MDD3105221.1 D-xylose transporter XylE [Bacteroidales bacterium]MDD3549955.1 D-xylose transporter XylE [Bacteroidales bacterium]MDD4064975.1 D-xylose transporter XylE [Bacteroidales bacterium]MDD4500157.1 D-xylose transporter XylE [Bacteroidales bacterium]